MSVVLYNNIIALIYIIAKVIEPIYKHIIILALHSA